MDRTLVISLIVMDRREGQRLDYELFTKMFFSVLPVGWGTAIMGRTLPLEVCPSND